MAGGRAPAPRKKGEVTLAKEAAAVVQSFVDDNEAWDGVEIPLDAIRAVLKHYRKLTKPKVSRKGRYIKGRAYEYELRDHFNDSGLPCRRVMQSGGGVEKDDLVLTVAWGDERLEAKRVGKLPAYLLNPGCFATICRMDRGDSLAIVPLETFTKLLPRPA